MTPPPPSLPCVQCSLWLLEPCVVVTGRRGSRETRACPLKDDKKMYVQSPFFFFFFVRWALPRFHTPPILGGLHHALAPHNHALARARIYPLTLSLPQLLPLFRALNPSLPNPRYIYSYFFRKASTSNLGTTSTLRSSQICSTRAALYEKKPSTSARRGMPSPPVIAWLDLLDGGGEAAMGGSVQRHSGGQAAVFTCAWFGRSHARTHKPMGPRSSTRSMRLLSAWVTVP